MSLAILDVDGTLVDTNYQHTISWARAFAAHDLVVPLWRIHTHIGMGGDQVVAALCGDDVEERLGDDIRDAESERYLELIDEVSPMEGKQQEVDHYLSLLDARQLADGWTTSADVDATKPAPDLVDAALSIVSEEPSHAVMVGDTPWDVRAAAQAGVETITVVTGGFSEQELADADAVAVYESVAALAEDLDHTRLNASSR